MTDSLPALDGYLARARSLRRRMAVGALVGALVGLGVFLVLPVSYTSTNSVALGPRMTYLSLDVSDKRSDYVTLDTVAALATSDRVVAAAARAMDVSPDEARSSTTVSAQPLSSVLRIHVEGSTRAQARAGSRAAAELLLSEQSRLFRINERRLQQLRNRVEGLRAETLRRARTSGDAALRFEHVAVLQERLDAAQESEKSVSLVLDRESVVRHRPLQADVLVVSGLMLGALIGLSTGAWAAASALMGRAPGGPSRRDGAPAPPGPVAPPRPSAGLGHRLNHRSSYVTISCTPHYSSRIPGASRCATKGN